MLFLKNYINGELVTPKSGQYLNNYEPATGEIYAKIPDSDEADVEAAVRAAKAAFPEWSTLPAKARGKILTRLAALIEENLERLALAEATDNGKPTSLARMVDIPRAASNFHFYGTAIEHYSSKAHAMNNQAINYTLRDALGVVGCISPWNLPLYLFSWKIAPALAAGNCVVAKPSEVTPMTAYLLSELVSRSGTACGRFKHCPRPRPKGRQCHRRASRCGGDFLHRRHANRQTHCPYGRSHV